MSLIQRLPRFRQAYRSLGALEEREGWARERIEALQLSRLNQVWQHAIAHVPHYRRLAAGLSLPDRFDTLAEFRDALPVLSKAEVKADPSAFLSERPDRGGWRRTGGSTGTPMSVYWGREGYRETLRAKYRFYQSWGVDIFDPTAFLWGHSASFAPGVMGAIARVRQPIEDRLRNRIRLSAYRLGRDDLRGYLRRIAAARPVSLYGYSRAIYLLAQEADATGFSCDSLKLIVLTGEPAFSHVVDTIERAFGAPAVVEYGSVECGVIATEGRDRRIRVREDLFHVETLPRDDSRYDIVLSVLCNPSFPLLRYAIADVTDSPLERPAEGFSTLANIAGRNNDLVLTRTGRYVHSARFDALFKYEGRSIRRFRVRQQANGALAVALEVDDPQLRLDTGRLEQKLSALVEGYPVRLEVVKAIPQTAAGKHRLVTSELALSASSASLVATQGSSALQPMAAAVSAPVQTPAASPAPDLRIVPRAAAEPAGPIRKTTRLRQIVESPQLSFLMEAHNGLSAKIVEEAGFEAVWASGLAMSAALAVRDSNEASWTQVLEVLEFMSDATRIPILVDGDTGYGNFNSMRRLVQKLEQRGIAGVCIEDKIFPKTNSFIRGTTQPLADIDEFCGRIKAGKDARRDDDFVIVARVEALIAGWGQAEAIKRAEAYHAAGADAILIHSAQRTGDEVIRFKEAWGDRLPVVIVPTKYYTTPTELFRRHRFSVVIWANHLMRSAITAMQRTAQEIFETETLVNVEDRLAPVAEVFRLQGEPELEAAEKRYLPKHAGATRAIVLASSRGLELGDMTEQRPKCMVAVSGAPVLSHVVETYRAAGIKDLAVVRGYKKEAVDLAGLRYVDNEEFDTTGDVYSLYKAAAVLEGHCVISRGHVLFKKSVPQELLEIDADFVVAVDSNLRDRPVGATAEYAVCSEPCSRQAFCGPVRLVGLSPTPHQGSEVHGQWMGFLKLSEHGTRTVRGLLDRLAKEGSGFETMGMADLVNRLVADGADIRVVYTTAHWLSIDTVDDAVLAGSFR